MSNIFCENNYCIYWESKKCRLKSIQVDAAGICAECINRISPEQEMERAREKWVELCEDLNR